MAQHLTVHREINPEDISAGDYVTITWEIEG